VPMSQEVIGQHLGGSHKMSITHFGK